MDVQRTPEEEFVRDILSAIDQYQSAQQILNDAALSGWPVRIEKSTPDVKLTIEIAVKPGSRPNAPTFKDLVRKAKIMSLDQKLGKKKAQNLLELALNKAKSGIPVDTKSTHDKALASHIIDQIANQTTRDKLDDPKEIIKLLETAPEHGYTRRELKQKLKLASDAALRDALQPLIDSGQIIDKHSTFDGVWNRRLRLAGKQQQQR